VQELEGKLPFAVSSANTMFWTNLLYTEKPKIVHLQLEYQWTTAERLWLLGKVCKKVGAKLVITMHSCATNAYSYNSVIFEKADAICIHSEPIFNGVPEIASKKMHLISMPVPDIKVKPVETLPMLGFFGLCYFHKGLDLLISAFDLLEDKSQAEQLLILSQQPKNDASYFNLCKVRAKTIGRASKVLWKDSYLSDTEIVQELSKCSLLVFPYRNYGTYSTSLAARLAVNAFVPTAAYDTDPFFEMVKGTSAPLISLGEADSTPEALAEKLKNVLLTLTEEVRTKQQIQMQKFKEQNTVQVCAKQHMNLYKSLIT
jgi:glycosyltransferase involved in cell wall biosynthesis